MKLKFIAMFAVAMVALNINVALANKSDDAFNACKSHISEMNNGSARVTLKKIRRKSGNMQVKVKVKAEGKSFTAVCLVNKEGDVTYTAK